MSKSKGKSSEHQETSSDSEHEEGSKDACKYLNLAYKRPKPTIFTQRITRFKYHRRAKLPRNIRVYEGNKDLEDYLGIFSVAAEQEEWPMPVWCKMFRQTLGGATRNWFDDLDPKSVDNFKELSQKFLKEFSQQKRESRGLEKVSPSGEDICQTNQRNGSQGRNSAKVINMIREGGNHKRSFEEGRSGLTDELTFPTILWNQLTDEPIIIEGIIEGRNTSCPGSNRSLSNYGKSIKKEALWECRHLERVQGSKKELKEGMIRKVWHPVWVANTILVKLENGTWKVQVDYSILNKICAKDMYPFSEEREGLASIMGYQYKCFLRLLKEYSQIKMTEDDEENTGFHTEEGVYCFTHMPKELSWT
nr:hypothetical protein [Tanacetum cinerariifolium]